MSQDFSHPSCKVLVTGTSGTGKTTLFESLVRKERTRLWFVYDHQGEFAARFKRLNAVVRGREELLEKTAKGGWVIFDPLDVFPGRSQEGFEFFCDYIFEVSQKMPGRKILAVDELQVITSNTEPPQSLITLCETGRRFQVDLYCISQAPNRLHNAVRNQLTEVYTFRHSDKNALEYLAQNGFDADEVRGLKPFEWIHRNLNSGAIRRSGDKV
jgi:hypothetical protein